MEKIACWLHRQGLICGNNLCKQKLGGFSLLLRSDVWSPLGEASLEQWKKGPWLFRVIIGDDATQLCGDYDKPLQGSLLNNQYSGRFFFHGSLAKLTGRKRRKWQVGMVYLALVENGKVQLFRFTMRVGESQNLKNPALKEWNWEEMKWEMKWEVKWEMSNEEWNEKWHWFFKFFECKTKMIKVCMTMTQYVWDALSALASQVLIACPQTGQHAGQRQKLFSMRQKRSVTYLILFDQTDTGFRCRNCSNLPTYSHFSTLSSMGCSSSMIFGHATFDARKLVWLSCICSLWAVLNRVIQ